MAECSSPFALVNQAYRKLDHAELVLFLKVRNLPTTGSHSDLASRLANHDLHIYRFPSPTPSIPHLPVLQHAQHKPTDLPVEILADIMDHLGDWELAQAVGVPTSLPRPLEWSRASTTDQSLISGYLPLIRASDPATHPPTPVGGEMIVRFGYTHVLEYFLTHSQPSFRAMFGRNGEVIPVVASTHGRTGVLGWWYNAMQSYPGLVQRPCSAAIAEAIDSASRNGQVASLDWWLASGLPLEYTEAALESASAKNHIGVLDWWKRQHEESGLPLKIGRVMDMASTAGHVSVLEWWASSKLEPKYDKSAMQHASFHGKIEVLDWWLGSGLQLIFDQDALTGASRHNRPEVLEWWDKSGLPIQYRMIDIEEALEDAIGGGEKAREWWRRKGVDFNANDKEWMKLRNLN